MASTTTLSKLDDYTPSSALDKTSKVLKAMLEFAPTQAGRDYVAQEIASCVDDAALHKICQWYINGLILPMRAHGCRTPTVSDHPSRASPQLNDAAACHLIETAKRDQEALKRGCLIRDHYRCVVTQAADIVYVTESDLDVGPITDGVDATIAAHIIPFSVAAKDDKPASIARMSATFEVLQHFGGVHLHELDGENINRFENVITLSAQVYALFGALKCWFEAVGGQANTYRFHKIRSDMLQSVPEGQVVQFRTADGRFPLPDPRYLAIHAAVAKICHASGAAKIIYEILRDYEYTSVLASDGSSSCALENALRLISVT